MVLCGYFARYGALGDSPLDIFKSFFTQPDVVWRVATEPARLQYLWGLLAPFGFFALLAPELILLALPVLLANLLSAYPAQYYGEFHYSAPLAPYFAVAGLYGLGKVWRWLVMRTTGASPAFQQMPAASGAMMAAVAMVQNARTALRPLLLMALLIWLLGCATLRYAAAGRGPLGGRYDPTPVTAHDGTLARLVAQLPAEAAVTATAAVHPHVSHRRYIYQFPLGLNTPVLADWALLDVTTNTDMAPGDLKARVDEMLAADWWVVDGIDGFLLLQRSRQGAGSKKIPNAFYDFARAPAAEFATLPPTDRPLDFYSLLLEDWPRWRATKLITHWRVGPGFVTALPAGEARPSLSVVTPDGAMIYDERASTPPALIWYPPERWQAGEVVQITSLPLYLPRMWSVTIASKFTSLPAVPTSADGQQMLVRSLYRGQNGQLIEISGGQPSPAYEAAAISPSIIKEGSFQTTPDHRVKVTAWLDRQQVWAGGKLNLWLQWGFPGTWPSPYVAFVHLRHQSENQAQQDGAPRFLPNDGPTAPPTARHDLADLRQFELPANAQVGEQWQVVMGLYEPASGVRATVEEGAGGSTKSSELLIGEVEIVAPPMPDQACALLVATCSSQP